MEPGKPLLLLRAYKLTLKQEGMSGGEHSNGPPHDTGRVRGRNREVVVEKHREGNK